MKERQSAIDFFERQLYSSGLIQILLKFLPFDQSTVSIHHIKILVGMLINQHPQLSLSDMIISSGFLNGQGSLA